MPRCDVLVVGAGLAGLWTARRLAGAGLDVVLVDGRAGVDQQIRTTGIFVRRTLEDFLLPDDCFGPAVRRVDYGSSLGDMLGLSRSRLLIASGSTFSMWGSYLGQVPAIWHPGKLLQHVLIAQPEREIEWAEGDTVPGWIGALL